MTNDAPQPGFPQPGLPQQNAPGSYPAAPAGYPQPGYAPPPPVWAVPPTKPSAMPDGPREYQQLLRGPRQRVWKPILSILLFAALAVVLINLLSLLLIPIGVLSGQHNLSAFASRVLNTDNLGPLGFAFVNLSLIILIPIALFSVWAVHRTKPRFLISVAGRFRWRWFARSLIVIVPIWLVYLGVSAFLEPPTGGRPPHWIALMIIVIISTPLQAAGEEFAFRGFITQVIGSWFRRPIVSLLVPLPFSVGLFALAHGSMHLWILVDLGAFALATFVLAWRTGGLESGIALHTVNNVLIMLVSLNLGGWQQGFVQSDTTGSAGAAFISLGVNALVTGLLLWQAKRVKLDRIYRPAEPTAVTTAQPVGQPAALPYWAGG